MKGSNRERRRHGSNGAQEIEVVIDHPAINCSEGH
jgi:hypothetical protein